MARLPRVCPVGVPQHVIQRGNNRQVCFASEQDFAAYAGWLKEYSKKYLVEIHAWVLMTNHVHLPLNSMHKSSITITSDQGNNWGQSKLGSLTILDQKMKPLAAGCEVSSVDTLSHLIKAILEQHENPHRPDPRNRCICDTKRASLSAWFSTIPREVCMRYKGDLFVLPMQSH